MYYSKLIELKKRKAGERYESYIAQRLRADGWAVEETGREGVNDHGIDLIATKDGKKRYIQCKGWNWHKTLHEDVVSQLYGSVAGVEGIENMNSNIEIYIYSSAGLSEYASAEAEKLHIQFRRVPLPRIFQKH